MENLPTDFQAPLSPAIGMPDTSQDPAASSLGAALAENISYFYAWYLAWDGTPSSHPENYRLLSQIQRIASACVHGGAFLGEKEEKLALESLNKLKNGLYDGTVRQTEISDYLQRIVSDLTFINHKARLISHTTELEYRLCIHPPENQSLETTQKVRLLLNQIITRISPSLQDRNAQGIDQEIVQILKTHPLIPNIDLAIDEMIFKWLLK